MRTRWVGISLQQAAPEMENRRICADEGDIDQFIFQNGIAIDRLVDWGMHSDDGVYAPHVAAEPVYEGRVLMEQRSEAVHVMVVPCGLEGLNNLVGFAGHNVSFGPR